MTQPIAESVRDGAAKLGARAVAQAIVMRRLSWSTQETNVPAGEAISIEPTFGMAQGKMGGRLRFRVDTTINGRVKAGEVFRLECTHEMFFDVPNDLNPSDEELAAFGGITVFFMVFPYIREVLQGLTVNAGLPPVLLQPLRLPINPVDGEVTPELREATGEGDSLGDR